MGGPAATWQHQVDYEQYSVRRDDEARFLVSTLERCGAKIIHPPDPRRAPLATQIQLPNGEHLELICYVFRANKYLQEGRPKDEHRFQVKYGSDFDRYHGLFIPDDPSRVTLMFGIHFDEDVVVAVDPAMHNPTWFSRSVEFKDRHLEAIKDLGWFGWERDRHESGRRKQAPPLESYSTEVLLGLIPEHFLKYIQFERVATALDPGERLLLIDRLAPRKPKGVKLPAHPLEEELGLSYWQILDMIDGAFRLKVAVRGSAAEEHLREQLEAVPGIDELEQIDEDGRPDFRVIYKGGKPIFIECKNVLRRLRAGEIRVDFQKTRASKNDPCSRYYKASDFEVLAACLHPITENWEFRFRETSALAQHPNPDCHHHLSHLVDVDDQSWSPEVQAVLEILGRPK